MDPTRTATLRRQFENELKRRFFKLATKIYALVVDRDVFGLVPATHNPFIGNAGEWQFRTSSEQVKAFQQWLATQIQVDVLDGQATQSDDQYWAKYIQEGFKKGAGRSFDDFRKGKALGKQQGPEFYKGSRYEFLHSAFANPETIDKVKLLAGRTFDDLKNVTTDMSTRISRALTSGLVQGKNPKAIARDMVNEVDGIPLNRARMIARTEIIRAHAEGQLDALEKLGVEQVGVQVEWLTAEDDLVCPECEELGGTTYEIDDAHDLIPAHPNCRCCFTPANVGEVK